MERMRTAERPRVGNPRNGRLGSLRYDHAASVRGPNARPLGLGAFHEGFWRRRRIGEGNRRQRGVVANRKWEIVKSVLSLPTVAGPAIPRCAAEVIVRLSGNADELSPAIQLDAGKCKV